MTSPPASSQHGATSLETLEAITTPRTGWLVGVDAEDAPWWTSRATAAALEPPGAPPLEAEALRSAAAQRQGVMLLFENGDPRLPVIIGLMQAESATPVLDAVLAEPAAESAPQPEPAPAQPPLEAHVDGKRVVIEAADEVVLQCGQASITLRRNGKVIIKGAYVETHSTGTNRIKGGSVQIN